MGVRAEPACVERSGNEFPERIEIRELSLRWIVEMRCRVVNIGRNPYDITHVVFTHEGKQLCDFEFTTEWPPVTIRGVFKSWTFLSILSIRHDFAERHIGRYHFPRRATVFQ